MDCLYPTRPGKPLVYCTLAAAPGPQAVLAQVCGSRTDFNLRRRLSLVDGRSGCPPYVSYAASMASVGSSPCGWALIPYWARGEVPAYSTINAMIEKLDTAPAWPLASCLTRQKSLLTYSYGPPQKRAREKGGADR